MKTCSLLLATRSLWLIALLLAGMAVSQAQSAAQPTAGQSKQPKAAVTAPAKASKPSAKNADAKTKVVTTGSYIPREVKRYRSVAETFSPVYVIDQAQIQQSGAATLSGVLRKTISGSR